MNKRWQVLLACLGIFAAGAVCGGVVALRYMRPAGPWRPAERGRIAEQLLKSWTEKLKLTEEQRAKIRPILLRGDDEMRQLRSESFRAGAAVMERMHAEVAAVLTPEQRVKLQELRERFRKRFRNRSGREPAEAPRPETPPPPPSEGGA